MRDGEARSGVGGIHAVVEVVALRRALDALEAMCHQYLATSDPVAFDHMAMSAGEEACDVRGARTGSRRALNAPTGVGGKSGSDPNFSASRNIGV